MRSINYSDLKFKNLRILNNLKVFNTLHQKSTDVAIKIQDFEILLGIPSLKDTITVVMSPYCPACAREYKSILKILKKHPNYAKVVIRFEGNKFTNNDLKAYTSAILMSHYMHDHSSFENLLEKWFENRNLNSFLKKHPILINNKSIEALKHQYKWSQEIKITGTPTTYLNNKKLPDGYDLEQLITMLSMDSDSQ